MAHGPWGDDEKHARDCYAARLFDLHGSEMAFKRRIVEILQAAVSSYTPKRVASPSMLPKYARKSSLTILSLSLISYYAGDSLQSHVLSSFAHCLPQCLVQPHDHVTSAATDLITDRDSNDNGNGGSAKFGGIVAMCQFDERFLTFS